MSDSDNEDPDKPVSPEELAEAAAFAAQVDGLLAEQALPAVLDPDEREFLELSAMINASHNEVALSDKRRSTLIDDAIAQANGVDKPEQAPALSNLSEARAKRQRRRWPVVATALVTAAIAFLVFRPRVQVTPGSPVAHTMLLPIQQQSRPSDALIGQIARAQSGGARERIDQIHGNRLSGYRALRYQRMVGKQ